MSISAIHRFQAPRKNVKLIENILKMFQISLVKTNREIFLTYTHVANPAIDVFGLIPNGQILKKLVNAGSQ